MLLRPACAVDVPAVHRLVRLAFLPYVPRMGREPAPMGADYRRSVAEGRCWVVEDEGRIVGMVQVATRSGFLEVETIAVAPDAQGSGVGGRLLAFAEERGRTLGLPEVRLCTNEAMTENIGYYRRRGFREVGRAVQDGYRRVFFAKPNVQRRKTAAAPGRPASGWWEPQRAVPRVSGMVVTTTTRDPVRVNDFEAFYRAYVDRVYRALAVTLRRDDLARDATAEAMARAYARWAEVGRLDNPAGWVFRVGLNWATSFWRKARRERPPAEDAVHPQVPPPDTGAQDALAALPTAQRAVITCRILLDLTTAETAAALGLSEGTVKSRLSRGLTALRSALEEGH
jgi:RNA polymerase sigma factor (sigma-70 family)